MFDVTLSGFFSSIDHGRISQNITNEEELHARLSSLEKEYQLYPVSNQIVANIDNLLNTKISDILVNAWNKYIEISECLNESRKSPNVIFSVSLAEHRIRSEQNPSLQVLVNGRVVREIKFNVSIALILKGMILEIKGGKIRKIHVTGNCQGKGTVECEGVLILEKKTRTLSLPGTIDLEEESQEQKAVKSSAYYQHSATKGKNPALAAILTLIILPVGYIYVEKLKRGLVVTIIGVVLGIITFSIGSFIILAIAIYDTYKIAKREPAPFDILNRWNLG
jgi:hypothetical protein